MKAKRAELKAAAEAAADKGMWKDPSRAAKVMTEKMNDVHIKTDGKAHICVMVFREDAERNALTLVGKHTAMLVELCGVQWR